MDDRDQNPDPEQLLAHAAWVRRLAARLVFDGGRVDDVVQETWLAALSADRARRGAVRDTRAWLGGILRNVVRRQLRGEGRRRTREAAAAHRGPPLSDDRDLVAEAERQRDLVDAVLALDEPYRATVLALDLAGQSAAELARREGCSAATVRSRHARALALLRGRLDQRHGDRRAWSLAWLPLLDPAAASAAGAPTLAGPLHWLANPTLPGVPLMSAKLVLSVAAVSVALVLAVWQGLAAWTTVSDGPTSAGPAPLAVVTAPEPSAPTAAVLPGPGTPATPLHPAPAAPAVGRPISFSGRVVDEHGEPVVGAHVELLPDGWTLEALGHGDLGRQQLVLMEAPPLDRGAEPWNRFPTATSDDTGHFALVAPLVLWLRRTASEARLRFPEIVVSAPGFARAHITCTEVDGDRIVVGEVLMLPGLTVAGRVVDAAGQPVAGAVLNVEPAGTIDERAHLPRNRSFAVDASYQRALSDADGRYRIDGLVPGPWTLECWADGFLSQRAEHDLSAGGEQTLPDVTLDRGRALVVSLTDAAGAPLPGASVYAAEPTPSHPLAGDASLRQALHHLRQGLYPSGGRLTILEPPVLRVSDADGQAHFTGLRHEQVTLVAVAPGHRPVWQEYASTGAAPISLALPATGQLVLQLRDDQGEPREDLDLQVLCLLDFAKGAFPRLPVSPGDAPASWLVDEVDSGPLLARVTGPDGQPIDLPLEGLAPPQAHATRTLTVPAADASVTVQFADEHGAALAGARLVATRFPEGLAMALADLRPREALSDADGRARLDDLAPGLWRLQTRRADSRELTDTTAGITLAAGEQRELALSLPTPGRLSGRVLREDGRLWTSGHLSLTRSLPGTNGEPWQGFMECDLTGVFLSGPLLPDTYTVSARGVATQTVTVTPGHTTEFVLSPQQSPLLFGRVTAGGEPVVDARVQALYVGSDPDAPPRADSATTDADGVYELRLSQPLPAEVTVFLGEAGPSRTWFGPWSVPAPASSRTLLDLELPTRSIDGVVVRADSGAPVPGVRFTLMQGLVGHSPRRADSDAAGRFTLEHLQTDVGTLWVSCPGFASQRTEVALDGEPLRVELEPGASLTLDLRRADGSLDERSMATLVVHREGDASGRAVRTPVRDGVVSLLGLPLGQLSVVLVDDAAELPFALLEGSPQSARGASLGELQLTLAAGDAPRRTLVVADS